MHTIIIQNVIYALVKRISISLLLIMLCVHPIVAQIPDLPEKDQDVYYGFENGAAGIVSSLLKVINEHIISPEKEVKVLSVVKKSMESLWEHRTEIAGKKKATWSKGPDFRDDYVYPGVKYGASGIIPVFLELYNTTGENKWIERALESYQELKNQAIGLENYPHWPYSYLLPKDERGLALFDYRYGSVGVLNGILELYKTTKDPVLLQYSKGILNYIDNFTMEVEVNGDLFDVYPLYNIPGVNDAPVYLGYNLGQAGIADILYSYAVANNDASYLSRAKELIDFIAATQKNDGSWQNLFNTDSSSLTNFEQGAAGIIYTMSRLNKHYNDESITIAIVKGINWLYSNFHLNETFAGFYLGSGSSISKNSIAKGNLGIYKALFNVLNLMTVEQREKLDTSLNWMIGKNTISITLNGTDVLFMKEPSGNYIDLCWSTGSAGFIEQLLKMNSVDVRGVKYNVSMVIERLIEGILYYQNIDGFWNRQVNSPGTSNSTLSTIKVADYLPYTDPSLPEIQANEKPTTMYFILLGFAIPVLIFLYIKNKK